MAISAKLVKELRERTGAGMMECKNALTRSAGDVEAAIKDMRKTGLAKAEKKAGRAAAEGTLVVCRSDDDRQVTLLEANCETDFVAIGDEFRSFARNAADLARRENLADIDALLFARAQAGKSIDETRKELIARIGENISLRRFVTFATQDGLIGHYLHGSKIGVLVEVIGGTAELAKDLAMHIAASNPQALDCASLPEALVAREKEIQRAKFEQSGKPAAIVTKMVDSAMKKFFSEVVLLEQKFVKNPSQSIGQLLREQSASVLRYVRYELGEGIAREASDFVAEVMAQAEAQ